MSTTLAKTNVNALATTAQVVQEFSILPEIQRKPRLYVGCEENAPSVFYAWDSEGSSRQYQQASRFTGMLTNIEIREIESEKYGKSYKLVTSWCLEANGQEIEVVVGAGTYCALSLVASLSGLTADQMKGMIGLSGKAGSKGVVFLSVFADGNKISNVDAADSMREARAKGNQLQGITEMVAAIKAAITA